MRLFCVKCDAVRSSTKAKVVAAFPNDFFCPMCGQRLVRSKAVAAVAKAKLAKAKLSNARLFVLRRNEDASGVSGTGIVAEGVCFSNGKVALHWLSCMGAVNVYDSMQVCETLHGHDGKTVIEWVP